MRANPRVPRYRVTLVRETSVNVQYGTQVSNADKAALVFYEVSKEYDREVLMVATLDSKNKIIGVNIAHMGSLSQSVAHPREILKVAILQNSAAIIIGHNHPSGDVQPSREDLSFRSRISSAADIMGIRFLDSIIIGETEYYSAADGGTYPLRRE